jgi:hypothetical protein
MARKVPSVQWGPTTSEYDHGGIAVGLEHSKKKKKNLQVAVVVDHRMIYCRPVKGAAMTAHRRYQDHHVQQCRRMIGRSTRRHPPTSLHHFEVRHDKAKGSALGRAWPALSKIRGSGNVRGERESIRAREVSVQPKKFLNKAALTTRRKFFRNRRPQTPVITRKPFSPDRRWII